MRFPPVDDVPWSILGDGCHTYCLPAESSRARQEPHLGSVQEEQGGSGEEDTPLVARSAPRQMEGPTGHMGISETPRETDCVHGEVACTMRDVDITPHALPSGSEAP